MQIIKPPNRCLSCFYGYMLNPNTVLQLPEILTTNNSGLIMWIYFTLVRMANVHQWAHSAKFNLFSGACTSCYPGYALNSGTSVVGNPADSNCKTFQDNVCTSCITGTYLSNGKYAQVNHLCKNYDPRKGACT